MASRKKSQNRSYMIGFLSFVTILSALFLFMVVFERGFEGFFPHAGFNRWMSWFGRSRRGVNIPISLPTAVPTIASLTVTPAVEIPTSVPLDVHFGITRVTTYCPRDGGSGGQQIEWSEYGNETGYRLQRCDGLECQKYTTIQTLGANVLSSVDTDVLYNRWYSYRIVAVREGLSDVIGAGKTVRYATLCADTQ